MCLTQHNQMCDVIIKDLRCLVCAQTVVLAGKVATLCVLDSDLYCLSASSLLSTSEVILPQQLRLPHVLSLWEAIRNPYPAEVLDAFLQLLLWSHLLLIRFSFRSLSVTDPEGPHP